MPKKTADDFLDGPKSADDFLDEKESADDFLGNVAPTPKPSATRSWDEGAPVEDIGAWEEETPLAPAINTQFERKLKSAGGAVGGMVMGIGGAITASGALDKKVLGVGEFEVKLGKSIASYGKRMAEFYQIQDPTFTDKLAAAATSGAVFFVPGYGIAHGVSLLRAAPKLAALIGAGLSSGFESAIEAGLVHETMKEKGASDDDALAAAGKTFAANLALNTGLNYAGGLFRKALPGGASETLKDAVLSAGRASGAESVQEAAQQVISNLTTGEEWAGGVGESALLGGIVGGGMSAVMDVAGAIDQAPGDEAAPGGPEAPTLPIRKNIPEGVLEQAAQMLATDPVSALKNITEPGQWAKVNDLAASVIDDVQAEGIPEDQVQEEVKARLTQIFQETTGTAPEAAEGPPAALQAADAESDAVIQQALTEHDKAQQQAAQVAETDKALTTPEPVSGKPIIDMSEAEYVAAARAEDPELDPEDAARMYEAAMQEAKGLNLVDDQHLAEINDVALQSEADMAQETAVDLPEEHSFDLTPETTQEAGSVPAMTLEEAQGRFPGLTEAQHKSMVQDAVDAYQLAPGDIPKGYEDLRTYAEDKLAAEQKEDFIKEELKRQLAEKGHMTPVLNMLFKNKLDRKRSARFIGGELDAQELRGYFTDKGGLSVAEAAERAWVNGWIADNDENLLFDEIDNELRRRDVIQRRGKGGVITEGVTRGRLGLREEGAKYRPKEYRGEHTAPNPESGAPGHDLTGKGNIYPADVYSNKAVQYYGDGNELDAQTMGMAQSLKDNPNADIKIYRAIPDDVNISDKIFKIEKQKAHILKTGKVPENVNTNLDKSDYYDQISAELDRLKALSAQEEKPISIEPGDWVSINRNYVKNHGESALNGNYKIISKTVKAKEIFTNGDSIHEWGYWPEGAKYRPTAAPETSEFKAWFKDSKVVDEQGKPLVVHRGARGLTSLAADNYPGVKFFSDSMGTAQRFADEAKYILTIDGKQRPITEDEFRIISENIEPTETLAWHEGWDLLAETDAKVADKVRAEVGVKDAKSISVTLNKNLVESVYLNLKNPFIYDAQGKTWGEEGIAPELFIKRAKKGGHDGIIAKNIVEGGMADPDLRPTTTYLTFSPNQIKSVNNRGTFDPSSPNIFKSPAQDYQPVAPAFYSKLQRLIETKMSGPMPTEQLQSMIKAAGIKQDELDWYDLDGFLKDNPKPTKAQVLEYLAANQLEIKEITKSKKGLPSFEDIRYHAEDGEPFQGYFLKTGNAKVWIEKDGNKITKKYDNTGFGFDALQQEYLKTSQQKDLTKFSQYQIPGGENYREVFLTAPESMGNWRDGHAEYNDVRNPIVRVRINDRIVDGKKTLFIEEIQPPKTTEMYPGGPEEEGDVYYDKDRPGMPKMYQGSKGMDLGIKHLIRYASENGYDAVAWTTGEQQAERYDLSKYFKEIAYARVDDHYDLEGILIDGSKHSIGSKTEKELPEFVGKELAAKIVSGGGRHSEARIVGGSKGANIFEDLDLKVGGEDLKKIYDQSIPSFVNKFTKKWGGRVESINIPSDKKWMVTFEDKPMRLFNTEAEAKDVANRLDGIAGKEPGGDLPVHSLAITPDLKRAALTEGFPLFERGRKYAPAGMPAELAEALNLTPAQRYAQSAWHGSPHDFDQFLLHKIGTGEGAQAYGYGLYFAGDRAVAEYYKEGLSRDIATFEKDDKTLSPEEMLKEYFKPGAIVHSYGGRDKVIRFIEKTGDWRSWSVEVQEVNKDGEVIGRKRNHCTVPTTREFTEVLEKAGWKRTAGKLYEVEIPESDKMLDWDKPLSEQTETVKEAIKKGFDKFETLKKELETVNVDSDKYTELFNEFSKYASFKNAIKRPEQYTGNSLYFAMTEGKRDDSARVASETLNSLGIKGIKYLDAISRGKGEGSHNYVIFDDNLIKIINKYSEKPAGHVYQPTEFIIEDDALAPAASQQAVSDVRQVRPVGQWHDLRTDNPAIDQINQQTMEKGFASVIGMKVQTIQDVAEIDGFFIRHPGIEHAVVTKIKNGRITGSKVFTSGKVEFVDPDTKEVQDFVADADEFYMSHNHPSGNATPSQEDIDSTKRMASDKRFKGHVVTDHQTYTAIAPDGTATAQAFREEKQSFRTDIEKMSLSPAIVGWSRGVLEGDRLGIMFVDTQLQVMSFDQVDPRSNYNLYIKRHSTKYGAAGVFLVAGESAASQMAPRHLAGNYHDLLVMKDNGTYESAALGYVPGFTVAEAEGNGLFEASSYAETPGKYNPQDYNRMMGRYKPGMTITLRSRLTSPIVPAGLPRGTAGKLVAVDAKSGEMLVDFDGKILMVNPSLFKETYREPGALQPGQRPLKFIDTVKGMENVAPEVKDSIEGHYDPMTHDASMAEARAILAEDYNKAFKLVFDSGVLTPSTSVTQALSALVFMKAQNEGNFELVEQILKHVAEISKTSGQTIEALKMFRLLTPAGMLRHAENIIEAAQAAGKWGDLLVKMKALGTDEARAAFAKKHGIPHMSKAQADSLYNESAEISKMEEGYDKELATGVMLRHISEMVPKSLWDKVAAVQRMGQLLAFKTFDRNIIGNIGFAVLNNFNQFMVATPLDIAVGKLTGKRTQTIPKWAAYRTGFMTGTVQGAKESWAGVELSVLHNKYDLPNGFTFVNPFMRFAERVLSLSLRATDKAFLFAEKASSVEGQMKVAEMNNEKLKIPTPEILQLAHMDGLYVTFNDPNALRSAMTALKKNLTKISDVVLHTGGRWGAGNQVINYPGTPSSLVMRAVEYSPFNFMQTLYILGRAGVGKGFDQREFIKQTSRAITGSVFLVGTGYIMASLGLITGDDDDPRSIKALKLSTGVRGFQMNISAIIRFISSGMDPAAAKRQPNDLLISYDWFQPAAIGLAMGANMQQSKKRTGELSVLGSTASAAKTITEQPLLQGVSRLFSEGNINIDDEDIKGGRVVGGIMRTLKDTPASFTPQTWNAVQQFADNTSRNARSRDYVTESVNRVKMRIPGLAEDLAPNVDVLGKVRENYQDGSNSFFNVFLNPAFVARYKPTPTTELVLGIWARSGETIQLPRIAPRSIRVQGVKRPLTEWEQAQFQHYIGERTANVFNGLSASEGFMALSDQDKASELRTITTDIYNEAKFKVLGVE